MDATAKETKKKSKKIYIAGGMAVLVLLLAIVCVWYVNDYYRADKTAMEAFQMASNVARTVLEDGTVIFEPEQAEAGFIFYPGGCHAYFGVYGEQAGDSTPTISNVEQIQMTVEQVADFMQTAQNIHSDESITE